MLSLNDDARKQLPEFPKVNISLPQLRSRLTMYDGCNCESEKPPINYCDFDLQFCVQNLQRSGLWSFATLLPPRVERPPFELLRKLVCLVVTQLPVQLSCRLASITIADDDVHFTSNIQFNGKSILVNDLILHGLAYADTAVASDAPTSEAFF